MIFIRSFHVYKGKLVSITNYHIPMELTPLNLQYRWHTCLYNSILNWTYNLYIKELLVHFTSPFSVSGTIPKARPRDGTVVSSTPTLHLDYLACV